MNDFNKALNKSLETAVNNGKVNRYHDPTKQDSPKEVPIKLSSWDESGSPIEDVRESIERAKNDAGIKTEE